MNIDGIAARAGALGPRAIDALSPAVRRLVTEDLPRLLRVARAAKDLVGPDQIGKTIDMNVIESFLEGRHTHGSAVSAIMEVAALVALKRALEDGDPTPAGRVQIVSELLDPPADEDGEKPEPFITREQALSLLR